MLRTHDLSPTGPSRRSPIRWAAIGAAVAVALGAGGGFGFVDAVQDSGARATYTPISPCRLTDTRSTNQIGPRGKPLGPDDAYTIEARGEQGRCSAEDLPTDATALVLNVTALGATELSFLTFWPDGDRPEAASLNPAPGAPPVPNAVTTQLSDDGSFDVYNASGSVNVVIDVAGFYTDHNHDDRYYTKDQVDQAVDRAVDEAVAQAGDGAGGVDAYTKAETDAAIQAGDDGLFDLLIGPNGPIKINTNDIQANENHLERPQSIAVNRLEFHPLDSGDRRGVAKGAYVTTGGSLNELWAPVTIPTGAIVTGVRARVLDDTGGASIGVQLFRVSPNGGSEAFSTEVSTVGEVSTSSVREFKGDALFTNNDDDVSYEVRARVNQGNFWNVAGVAENIQVVAFYVDYEMEVAPVS